jgi:flavin reductase (DIM6/NTAB) family NADH-FMN oxidoreductase RutF
MKRRELSSQEFREVIGHFASGVTIVTTVDDGVPFGTTASAICSLSVEPPMLLVSMNRASATGQTIARAGRFAVNILAEGQADLAERFSQKGVGKFDGISIAVSDEGLPLLPDSVAQLQCRVTEEVPAATHVVFLAEVTSAEASAGPPLAYFRGEFGRLDMAKDERAYATLRDEVASGRLRAGTAFGAIEVATRLGLQLSSVHQALGRLVSEGLVERTDNGTYAVAALTWPVVEQALVGCSAIEQGAAGLSIATVDREQLRHLRLRMEAVTEHIRPGQLRDPAVATRESAAFHEYVVGMARSEPLVAAFRRLALPALMVRTFKPYVASEVDLAFATDYRGIVKAYETRDADLARARVARYYERLTSIFQAGVSAG